MNVNTRKNRRKTTTVVLILTFLTGLVLGVMLYPLLEEQTAQLASTLKKLVTSDSRIQTTANIFIKNNQAAVIMLITGPTVILPILAVAANGFIAGLIIRLAYENGRPLWRITLSLLPHGILELTALFLTATAGINVGLTALRPQEEKRLKATSDAVKQALKTYVTKTMPLLLIAALTETYISQWLIQ